MLLRRSSQRGISLMESLAVLAILAVLFALTMRTFSSVNASKALDTETLHIVSELNRARSLTLSSLKTHSFGLHFATTSLIFFQGPTYEVGSSTNETIRLNKYVQIASTNLIGGGSDVVFQRISGETTQSGTIVVSLVSDTSKQKTVTIRATGLVESQ